MGVQLPLAFGQTNQNYSLANYIPTENKTAYQALHQVIQRQSENCLYLWGASGTGKTHLLQAACRIVTERGGTPAYLPLADVHRFSAEVLEGLEHLDLVCLDDVHHIVGSAEWENGIFKLFNQLRESGTPLLISGHTAPNALGLTLTDLVSRFSWGGVFYLEPLNEKSMREVVQGYADLRGLRLPASVISYLMRHAPHDLKTLLNWVERIDYVSMALKKKPNLTFVRNLMSGEGVMSLK